MKSAQLFRTVFFYAGFILFFSAFASCNKAIPDDGANAAPFYDIDAKLEAVNAGHDSRATGYIEFRQAPDTARIITLDTWIRGLQPNHPYFLQRAVNPITDNSCSSTAWLTLGFGLTPQNITTDAQGNGHEELFRDITAIARGTQFRIHFQVVDAVSLTVVLSSDCYQYTVR